MNLYTPKDRNGKTFHVGDLVEIGEGAPEEFHGDKARVKYVVRLEDLPQLPVHSGHQAMLSPYPMLILDEEDGGTSAVFANTITILEQGDGEELVFEETPQPSAPKDIHGREIKAGDTVRIAGKRVKQDYQGRVVEVSDPTPTIERIALINPRAVHADQTRHRTRTRAYRDGRWRGTGRIVRGRYRPGIGHASPEHR